MLLYFAGQGAGRVAWLALGGTVRLLVAAGIGWVVVADLGGGLRELFIAVAASSIVSGGIVECALWLRGWGPVGQPWKWIRGEMALAAGSCLSEGSSDMSVTSYGDCNIFDVSTLPPK
jgi:hypothetical protein